MFCLILKEHDSKNNKESDSNNSFDLGDYDDRKSADYGSE